MSISEKFVDPVPYNFKNRQLFFLHIPKTAGTTFSGILRQYFAPNEILPAYEWFHLFDKPLPALDAYSCIMGHFNYNFQMLLPTEAVTVTFLRHPIERALSHFEHGRRATTEQYNEHQPLYKAEYRHDLGTLIMSDLVPPAYNNLMCRMLAGPKTPVLAAKQIAPEEVPTIQALMQRGPSLQSAPPNTRLMLDLAKQRLEEIAFVGMTERFEESMYLFSHLMGWPPVVDYQRQNTAKRKVHADTLSDDLRERLLELNQLDLELYDFAQKLFQERLDDLMKQVVQFDGTPTATDDAVRALLSKSYQESANPIAVDDLPLQVSMDHVLPSTFRIHPWSAALLRSTGWARKEGSTRR